MTSANEEPDVEEMSPESTVLRNAVERLRVIVFAGVALGVLVGGVGGRLAMLVLRVTSADSMHGVVSDDGFEIGRVTLAGTYSLMSLGAAIGVIGSAAYELVAPSLLGPRWFGNVTCALGAGVVVGSMLVHTDGIDFTLLQPTWLAISLFVSIPACFGLLIGPMRRVFERRDRRLNSARRLRWTPLIAVAIFPVSLFPTALVACGVFGSEAVRVSNENLPSRSTTTRWSLRVGWLLVATLGLFGLLSDVQALV